jgi:predicted acylesterase/phospholipase RssA
MAFENEGATRRTFIAGGTGAAALAASASQAQVQAINAVPFRVLAIDGGGYKGVIPATMIAEIDEQLEGKIVDQFDLFAGTSTGAIVAAGLANVGVSPALPDAGAILELYERRGGEIFQSGAALQERLRTNFLDWWGPSFSSKGVQKVLKESLGDTLLSASPRDFLCTYYTFSPDKTAAVVARGGPGFRAIADNPVFDQPIWQAVQCSSSAPPIFSPIVLTAAGVQSSAVDGGVFANNPSLVAYLQAVRLARGRPIEIVSLGCGGVPSKMPSYGTMGIIEWITPNFKTRRTPLATMLEDAKERAIEDQLSALTKFIRHQPDVSAEGLNVFSMANAKPENFRTLKAIGQRYVATHPHLIDDFRRSPDPI